MRTALMAVFLIVTTATSCDDADTEGDGDSDGDIDGDVDGDSDGDTDGDTDIDADGDSDGDTDGDGDIAGDADIDADGDAGDDAAVDADGDSDAGPDGGESDGGVTLSGNFERDVHGRPGGPEYMVGIGQAASFPDAVTNWESWMGIDMDVYVAWTSQTQVSTWADYENGQTGYHFTTAVQYLPADIFVVHAYPIIPTQEGISNKDCANSTLWADIADGDYDAHYTAFARNTRAFQEANGRDYLNHGIRLGWEMNGDWYPWSICDQVGDFKTAYAHIVSLFRTEMPGLIIDFSPARNNRVTSNGSEVALSDWAPASTSWDVISRSTHDGWYGSSTAIDQDTWEEYHLDNPSNSVVDLTDIEALAARENRWMALTEWATQFSDCNDTTFRAAQDQDFFIQKSYEWISTYEDRIAWIAYFSPGCTALHTRQTDTAAALFRDCFADGTC